MGDCRLSRIRIARFLTHCNTALVISFASVLPVLASPDTDMAAGMAAYQQKNYRVSASYLQRAVSAGLSTTSLWMYLGHAYIGCGDRAHAVEAYAGLISNFKGTPEAAQAMQYLQRFDPAMAKKVAAGLPIGAAASGSGTPGAGALPTANVPFKDRIILVPPAAGHQAVSESTRAAVKAAIARLPAPIYKILDEGGATVNLAPNIEDKWPGSGDGDKPTEAGVTMGEEPGRTYGHDSYIYERKKYRGSNELGEARSSRDIVNCLYHELGHAVDDCLGRYSNDPALKAQFQLDLNDTPASVSGLISYFLVPSEGCAEIVSGLLGSDADTAANCREAFPRTKRWLRAKLKI